MDDFEKFHLRKAARTKRRPLADISTNVNKPTLHQNKTPTAKTTRQHPTKTKISHLLGISKSLNIIRPRPNTNKSAFSSKSLLFDIQSCPEPPQFEPRYKALQTTSSKGSRIRMSLFPKVILVFVLSPIGTVSRTTSS